MKKVFLLFVFILLGTALLYSQNINYQNYFTSEQLRIDLIHAGNADGSFYYLQELKKEPFWGGSKKNLIDKFEYGEYRVEVYDKASGKLIYTRGFTTLFQEWVATTEAKTVSRSLYETIVTPFPKDIIKVQIHAREKKKTTFKKVFELEVNPVSYFISPERPGNYETKKVLDSGNPAEKVDVVILPEGYTKDEYGKFNNDVNRMVEYFFKSSPFKENKNKFNFWFVFAPSEESGTDFPSQGIWKQTKVNTSFSTFDVERYCMTYDVKSVRDVAGFVPYDQIIILVNTNVYGGGGIYNYYSITSADNKYTDYVIVHEFGHAFGGLADEYYTSEVAVEDYYDFKIEPYEPNITTLVNFEKKWKNLILPGTPIPTPNTTEYSNVLGVFEGGGYVEKGVYRPMFDCTMKSIKPDAFCIVCKNALIDMINFYAE